MNEKNEDGVRMVGAKLTQEKRDQLSFVLRNTKRTFKGQLETWIDNEVREIMRAK